MSPASNLALRFWHAPDVATLWRERSEVAVSAKQALPEAGISLPRPQREIQFDVTLSAACDQTQEMPGGHVTRTMLVIAVLVTGLVGCARSGPRIPQTPTVPRATTTPTVEGTTPSSGTLNPVTTTTPRTPGYTF